MNNHPHTQYQRRLNPAESDVLRVRLERPLADLIKTLQDHPAVIVKGNRKPSRSLILRRAIRVYADHLRSLKPSEYERETGEIARLA